MLKNEQHMADEATDAETKVHQDKLNRSDITVKKAVNIDPADSIQ